MSFDSQTKIWTTGLHVDSNCTVEEFAEKLLATKNRLVEQGYSVTINNDRSGDEWWDSPLTTFNLKLTRVISDEVLAELEAKARVAFEEGKVKCIKKYREENSEEVLKAQEEEYLAAITLREKDYAHVFAKRGNNPEDAGTKSAATGVENAKAQLARHQEKMREVKANPKTDEQILSESYSLKSFNHWYSECDVDRYIEQYYKELHNE